MKYLLIILLFGCAKEKSCEGCREPKIDTIQQPDTIYNDLIARCSIYIPDESKVRAIYPQMMTKEHPGHFYIFATIKMDGRHIYDTTFDLKKHLPMEKFYKGDTVIYRNEIRMKIGTPEYVQEDTLVY